MGHSSAPKEAGLHTDDSTDHEGQERPPQRPTAQGSGQVRLNCGGQVGLGGAPTAGDACSEA